MFLLIIFFIVGEGPSDFKSEENDPHKIDKEYNNKFFQYIRTSFPILFPRREAVNEHNIDNLLLGCFNKIINKYLISEKVNIAAAENERIIVHDIKPNFCFKDSVFRIENQEGYKFVTKSIPISLMLSQYPSSLAIANICYQVYNERNQLRELICQLECPGCDISSIQIDSSQGEFWTISMKKEKLDYQTNLNISNSKYHLNNLNYGTVEVLINIPNTFQANILNYQLYYGNGILVVQILHQYLLGKPITVINLPKLVKNNDRMELVQLQEKEKLNSERRIKRKYNAFIAILILLLAVVFWYYNGKMNCQEKGAKILIEDDVDQ